MSIRVSVAILAGKCSMAALKILGKGGTSLPGRIVLKICPDILGRLAKEIKVIGVTGTNGKTTTCHIIRDMIEAGGSSCFCNDSGANLLQGVVSTFVNAASISGKIPYDYALLECDEAALKSIVKHFGNLDVSIVVTNIFRDQLDRYGEVLTTVSKIKEGLELIPNVSLYLNADCSLTTSLEECAHSALHYFGIEKALYEESSSDISDAVYCIKCKAKYKYTYHTFGHLGGFYCENCGYKRKQPDTWIEKVEKWTDGGARVTMNLYGESVQADITLPGGYNLYNAMAAVAVGCGMGLSKETMLQVLSRLTTHFGRMEKVMLDDTELNLVLVKNPAGYNEVIQFLIQQKPDGNVVLGLNDNYADGKDVSWIWDVEFERFVESAGKVQNFFFTGIRAYDMQIRFKYAGFDTEKFSVMKDYRALIEKLRESGKQTYLVLSYTCMLAFRDKLSEVVPLKKYQK